MTIMVNSCVASDNRQGLWGCKWQETRNASWMVRFGSTLSHDMNQSWVRGGFVCQFVAQLFLEKMMTLSGMRTPISYYMGLLLCYIPKRPAWGANTTRLEKIMKPCRPIEIIQKKHLARYVHDPKGKKSRRNSAQVSQNSALMGSPLPFCSKWAPTTVLLSKLPISPAWWWQNLWRDGISWLSPIPKNTNWTIKPVLAGRTTHLGILHIRHWKISCYLGNHRIL